MKNISQAKLKNWTLSSCTYLKTPPEKFLLTSVELQQTRNTGKTHSKEDFSWLKWAIYIGMTKL